MKRLFCLALAVVMCAGCKTASLHTSVMGSGTVKPLGTHTYPFNKEVIVSATGDEGWKFSKWEGTVEGTANPISVKMDEDKTIVGVFEFQWPPWPTDVPNVDDWLNEHATVQEAIQFEHVLAEPFTSTDLSYAQWPPKLEARFHDAFIKTWRGESSGLDDPLININPKIDDDDTYVRQYLSLEDGEALYLAYLANSLVVEMGSKVPWSILDYDVDELSVLFNSRQFFNGVGYDDTKVAYEINLSRQGGRSLPTTPEAAWAFLHDSGVDDPTRIVGPTRAETIANLIQFFRKNVIHFTGRTSFANCENHWLYRGFPPAIRTIEGTVRQSDQRFYRYTAGCHGTTGFFRTVLRTVNIPVQQTYCGGHSLTYFISEDEHMSHGDDPYGGNWRYDDRILASEVPIDEVTYAEWFGPVELHTSHPAPLMGSIEFPEDFVPDDLKDLLSPEEYLETMWFQGSGCDKVNVGRTTRELVIQYLPDYILHKYCEDIEDELDHEAGSVNSSLRNWTAEELEAMNLWDRMDAKIADMGGCENVPAN